MKHVLLVLLTAGFSFSAKAVHEVKPLTEQQAREYKLDTSFYRKVTLVQGILIATSAKVSDLAHRETAYQFDMLMRSMKPEIAERIRKKKVLCLLIGHNEFTSQLPQFATNKKGEELDYYNWRQRGFLSHIGSRPTVVFAEEDVMEYEGGMQLESILIHEFGHVVHGAGFDEALQKQLTATFANVKKNGIWNDGRAAQRYRRIKSETPVKLLSTLKKSFPNSSPKLLRKCLNGGDILVNGKKVNAKVMVNKDDKVLIYFGGPKQCYAAKNRSEYWAEIYQCWFNTNRTMDHDHNHIHTREQLIEYDPIGAKLCEDVLGKPEWRFVSPRKRVGEAHLKTYNYSLNSPKVTDLPHIQKAAYDYYDTYWKEYWQRLYDKYRIKRK
ncbi:MAG TPA: hypothetical protein QGH16_02480 [Verrucomicrobiota bacterium]|jgi:hypothetical protein|nr:hypothetical protein [Verrucomicrobiota bacterium]